MTAEQERDALAAQVLALRVTLTTFHWLAHPSGCDESKCKAALVLADTAAAGEAARQRIVAEANLRHHDAVRAVDAADEEDRQRIVTDWLASPEAERRLAEALTPNHRVFDHGDGTWPIRQAQALLANLREQEAGK